MKSLNPVPYLVIAGLLAGCGRAPRAELPRADAPALPAAFQAAMPEVAPTPIPAARRQFRPGETVVLEGKIMGVKTPFAEGRAVFVLGDTATLTPCNARPDDNCPTPWDVCCDTPEARREGTATVQLLDAQGAVLKHGLKGVGGLKELSRVRVAGTVDAKATPEALLVNATSLRVLADVAAAEAPRAACCPGH